MPLLQLPTFPVTASEYGPSSFSIPAVLVFIPGSRFWSSDLALRFSGSVPRRFGLRTSQLQPVVPQLQPVAPQLTPVTLQLQPVAIPKSFSLRASFLGLRVNYPAFGLVLRPLDPASRPLVSILRSSVFISTALGLGSRTWSWFPGPWPSSFVYIPRSRVPAPSSPLVPVPPKLAVPLIHCNQSMLLRLCFSQPRHL